MRFNLRQLKYIDAAARSGSLTQAAKEMRVSKSSISAAIDSFEENYKITLFTRQPSKGIVLTSAGKRALTQMQKLISQAKSMEEKLSGQETRLTGEFKIGCFSPLAPIILPYAVREMSQRHPGLKIHIEEGNLQSTSELVLEGTADVVLTYDLDQPAGTEFIPVKPTPPYALVDSEHVFAEKTSVSLVDLAPLPMIMIDLPESRTYFEMLFKVLDLRPNVVFSTSSFQTLRSLVSHGLGYTLLNLKPATEVAYTGRTIISLALTDSLPMPIIGVLQREEAYPSAAATEFISICKNYCLSEEGKQHFVDN